MTQRSLVYRLLARVFRREPDQELLDDLGSSGMLRILGECSPGLETDALLIADDARIDQLAIEFCRLFVGPNPPLVPCESVHRAEPGNSGRFWGDSTVEFNSLVESLGLRYSDDFHEMPDHLSAEFELIYRLLDAEAEALESGDEETRENAWRAQEVLFKRHLAAWLPGFCARLEAATDDPFYAAIAVVTRDFLAAERRTYLPADAARRRSGSEI